MHPFRNWEIFRPLAAVAALAALGGSAMGCTPSIGDKCSISTDCSLRNERICDTSQPGGYCTLEGCSPNKCPDQAACTLFNAAVPGCGFDDRSSFRTARTFCMARCGSDSDCRDGYVCADPRLPPWNALILDDDQNQHVCITAPSPVTGQGEAEPPVCRPGGNRDAAATPIDASPAVIDAGTDAENDAPSDGAADAQEDAPADASDSG
jgi:hypothetical protein